MNHRVEIHLSHAGGKSVVVNLYGERRDIASAVEVALKSRGWCWIGDVLVHPGSIAAIEFSEYGGSE